jgi:hypothetical protein
LARGAAPRDSVKHSTSVEVIAAVDVSERPQRSMSFAEHDPGTWPKSAIAKRVAKKNWPRE